MFSWSVRLLVVLTYFVTFRTKPTVKTSVHYLLTFIIFVFGQMGRNPIQNAGCFGILKSVKDNPDSAMEALDFSVTHTYPTTMRPSA